ncbi:hypothetical protein J5N97_000205 [Dioscorea zingiberensis]|uniref:Uncharacterized protein n=1 Tax=Dioscorea zingiberensis TaxID=325984 RepID=A0A9D5BSM5_9LILI|nr:hypothetical protein J5N97_000205 [Dioscorea zingiberensis]
MGNCLKLRPVRTWVDDEDWDFADLSNSIKQNKKEKKAKAGRKMMTGGKQRTVVTSSIKLKIKLTKKQFEDLMQLVEMHGLQIEQALTHFINKSNVVTIREFGSQIAPWNPVLQCIPEEC